MKLEVQWGLLFYMSSVGASNANTLASAFVRRSAEGLGVAVMGLGYRLEGCHLVLYEISGDKAYSVTSHKASSRTHMFQE